MENVYESFTDCYLDLAQQVYNNPDFESSPRGMAVREKLACKFTITNPLDRLPYVPVRKFSATYVIAELLWYLSAEDRTEWISNYSSFWNSISDDGTTANSAYGARIFKPHPRIAGGTFSQWDYVKEELRKDADSRRAVVHIRSPWDSVKAKLDVPCTLSLQFFIRDGSLHLVAHMRSSDLILGIAYDVPAFTLMQELMARELGVKMGTYTHVSNSLHIYERHFEMVEGMISKDSILESMNNHRLAGPMPEMPSLPPTEVLYNIESQLRVASTLEEVNSIVDATSRIPVCNEDYWTDWVKILAAHRCSKLKIRGEKKNLIAGTSFAGYRQF
jgi:thymidylate synthase